MLGGMRPTAIAMVWCVLGWQSLFAQQQGPQSLLDPRVYDAYLGTYQLPSGRLMVVARTERRLYAYEPGSERVRGLDRVDDTTWVAGPSLLVYSAETYRLTFLNTHR